MGFLRLFLALSVVTEHAHILGFTENTIFGFTGIGAWYAVNFFFIISGFYMAMVLNGKYRDTPKIIFYKSRVLRIFPIYYIGLLLGLWVSFDSVMQVFNNLTLGSQLLYVFQNLFLFGQDLTSSIVCLVTVEGSCTSVLNVAINPPSWSLAVELGFYLCAPFVLKDIRKTVAFFLIGCLYLLSLNVLSFPVNVVDIFRSAEVGDFNYYNYGSSFIFFGGGALTYHLSQGNFKPHYPLILFIVLLLSFTSTSMPFWHLLFISLSIPIIFNATASNKIDRTIGELSYPVYILHVPMLIAIKPFTESNPNLFEFITATSWVAILACVLGLVLYLTIENSVDKFRKSDEFLSPAVTSGDQRSSLKLLGPFMVMLYLVLPIMMSGYIYLAQNFHQSTPAGTAMHHTDTVWHKGIGRNFSRVLFSATEATKDKYKVGSLLMFKTGEIRKILKTKYQKLRQGYIVIVQLDGSQPLKGDLVGYPHRIEFLSNYGIFD